jgi:transcriptional regulatory protein LevR
MKVVNEKIIVAFLKKEEQQSEAIAHQLKSLEGAKEYEIYHFEADSAKAFVEQLDSLLMVGTLTAIVGTFDPELFNIRYIEASRIHQVSSMSELLEENEEAFDILGYLESQFEAFSREDLEATVVPFMNEYQKILSIHLDEDAYVGLMVHMACLIDRLMKNKTPIVNFDSDKIIEKYPQETRLLTTALEPIETQFHVSFLEGDVATLISIVKR